MNWSQVANGSQEVHVTEGVAGLTLRGVAEEARRLAVTLDVGAAREVEVTTVRLALAREGFLEVLVRLAACEVSHVFPPAFEMRMVIDKWDIDRGTAGRSR